MHLRGQIGSRDPHRAPKALYFMHLRGQQGPRGPHELLKPLIYIGQRELPAQGSGPWVPLPRSLLHRG